MPWDAREYNHVRLSLYLDGEVTASIILLSQFHGLCIACPSKCICAGKRIVTDRTSNSKVNKLQATRTCLGSGGLRFGSLGGCHGTRDECCQQLYTVSCCMFRIRVGMILVFREPVLN